MVTIKVIKPTHGEVIFSGNSTIALKRDKITKGTVNVSFPEKEVNQPKLIVTFGVYDSKGKLLDTFETNFEGPFKLQF